MRKDIPITPFIPVSPMKLETGFYDGQIFIDQSCSHPSNIGLNGFARNDIALLKEAAAANDKQRVDSLMSKFMNTSSSSSADLSPEQLSEQFVPNSVQSYSELQRYAASYGQRVSARLAADHKARIDKLNANVRKVDLDKEMSEENAPS